MVTHIGGLELTEDEAFALLGMCLTSPQALDSVSEQALKKLAEFCNRCSCPSSVPQPLPAGQPKQRRLELAGG